MADQSNIVYGKHDPQKRRRARELRHDMTPAERHLWKWLRAGRLRNHHFRRQQIIDGFIVDFYCHAAGLVIECDGDVHEVQQIYDAGRDEALRRRGLTVLRFRNQQVINDVASVLGEIVRYLYLNRPEKD